MTTEERKELERLARLWCDPEADIGMDPMTAIGQLVPAVPALLSDLAQAEAALDRVTRERDEMGREVYAQEQRIIAEGERRAAADAALASSESREREARECLRDMLRLYEAIVDAHGGDGFGIDHDEGCPQDDTCECSLRRLAREAEARARRVLSDAAPTEGEGRDAGSRCACGHLHRAGTDGEDCGCPTCDCFGWESP